MYHYPRTYHIDIIVTHHESMQETQDECGRALPVGTGSSHGHASDSDSSSALAVDLWRDTPVRFCGYANEVGEAFAAWLPAGGVPLSYAIAILYVFFVCNIFSSCI